MLEPNTSSVRPRAAVKAGRAKNPHTPQRWSLCRSPLKVGPLVRKMESRFTARGNSCLYMSTVRTYEKFDDALAYQVALTLVDAWQALTRQSLTILGARKQNVSWSIFAEGKFSPPRSSPNCPMPGLSQPAFFRTDAI
jgi:hypothetical protein